MEAEKPEPTRREIKNLITQIASDPSIIDSLTDEEVIEVKSRMNPIGTIAPTHKAYAVASVVNMREDYLRKFTITALIAFLYRRLNEYVPSYVIKSEEYTRKKLDELGERTQEERDALRAQAEKHIAEYKAQTREVIGEFLASMFAFDPDKHIRRAPTTFSASALDVITQTARAKDAEVAKYVDSVRAASAARSAHCARSACTEDYAAHIDESASIMHRAINLFDGAIKAASCASAAPLPDLVRAARMATEARDLIAPMINTRLTDETSGALATLPPADLYYHFSRYIDSHYEHLRLMTDELYFPNPDIDNIMMFYDSFPTQEEAQEFVRVHEAEFSAEPLVVENGAVTILGPFRENRERVDFYNKNTEVLRVMMEQITKDQKIGTAITNKTIDASKRKNVREAGPDDPGLEQYIEARGIVAAMGKKPHLSREDREKLAAAEQARAQYETPKDGMAVRVLAPVLDEDGVPRDLKQSFFYSAAKNEALGKDSASK